ncbi:MAG: ATP-binding protein, partial [Nocardia sp.]|nr:ATP-binding protein [Nocardia sp.]
MNEIPDPFDTAALRAAVLTAWRDSPTRLREDSATEADLVRAGYRDRLLTELAQNAADAAVKADVAGRLGVTLRGRALHIANTGAPLDISGVHSLTALRASAKSESAAAVGRFGVGFTAVLSAGEEIEFRSTTGSLRFSRADTRVVMRERGIELPRGAEYSEPPVLRLAWPVDAGPETGFDSEIVVWLREGVDASALLESMRTEAPDLLLELPGLRSIRIEEYESWSA